MRDITSPEMASRRASAASGKLGRDAEQVALHSLRGMRDIALLNIPHSLQTHLPKELKRAGRRVC
jgi:hypothetical protein